MRPTSPPPPLTSRRPCRTAAASVTDILDIGDDLADLTKDVADAIISCKNETMKDQCKADISGVIKELGLAYGNFTKALVDCKQN